MRLIVSLFMIATTLVGVSFKQDELEQRAVLAEATPPTVALTPAAVPPTTTTTTTVVFRGASAKVTVASEGEGEYAPIREWEGSIPEIYGEGSGCTRGEATIIANALWDRGASDDSVKKMLRIISRESNCDSSAHNPNRATRDDSWGLCQQNNLSGWFDNGKLLENYDRFAFADNFAYNAESCAVMWEECGVGPWNYGSYYCSTPRELR